MIAQSDGLALIELARRAVVARVRRERPPEPEPNLDIEASGVFVTIHHRGELRGCLGTLDPREPVAEAVVRLGGDVTHRDHRFDPVHVEELPDITLDISVLTMPTPIESPNDIVIGRDGLIVEQGSRRGLLLPQVATEHGFDRETFLSHTCVKAGLPGDAWQRGATVYRFEAEVFTEAELGPRS
jgi:AmmeMemoRadiSam system protein A